jgi:hypothetical protein
LWILEVNIVVETLWVTFPDEMGRPSTTDRTRGDESFSKEKDLSQTNDSLIKFEVAPESIIAKVGIDFPSSSTRSIERMRCACGSGEREEEETERGKSSELEGEVSEDSSESTEKKPYRFEPLGGGFKVPSFFDWFSFPVR